MYQNNVVDKTLPSFTKTYDMYSVLLYVQNTEPFVLLYMPLRFGR